MMNENGQMNEHMLMSELGSSGGIRVDFKTRDFFQGGRRGIDDSWIASSGDEMIAVEMMMVMNCR